MKIDEINGTNCKKDNNFHINKIRLTDINKLEQECNFTILKADKIILVCCSHQVWLNKLVNLNSFLLNEVLVSSGVGKDGYVLQISGTLEVHSISLRKKRKELTSEQKKELVDRMNKARNSKR